MSLLEMSFVVLCALAAVAAGLFFVSIGRAGGSRPAAAVSDAQPTMSFLFRDLDLEHASPGAETLVARDGDLTDWDALRANLGIRFPGLPDAARLQGVGSLTLHALGADDDAIAHLARENDITRLTIEDLAIGSVQTAHRVKTLEAELSSLRLAAVGAPYPIWLVDASGHLIWRNQAYDMVENAALGDAHDPAVPLFDIDPQSMQDGQSKRISVQHQTDDRLDWFSVTATQTPDSTVFHAVNIDAVILAEAAQRNFVQTLAKTFAQLSIGLAIFDRNGQLALFNPALVDLTSLPAEFLSARPDLLSFFDRLRDNRMMPEPKNYHSWRQEISDVIAAATHGSYQETWSLDAGHTYRVIGRPHPDGAVAFLIEDITAEISLTRNFRAELELGQSLMDTFEDALAVFSSAGVLTFCNAAYREMWKLDPDNSFADVTIVDSLKDWQAQCRPDPAWGDMRDFVMKLGDRAPWDAQVHHVTKGAYLAQLSPVASGATVIRFTEAAEARTPLPAT